MAISPSSQFQRLQVISLLRFLSSIILLYFHLNTSIALVYTIPSKSLPPLRRIFKRQRGKHANFGNMSYEDLRNETIAIDVSKYYNTYNLITTDTVGMDDSGNNVTNIDDFIERKIHERFMNIALEQAKEAGRLGEVPIGAIIVKEIESRKSISSSSSSIHQKHFTILSKGQNQIETLQDASAHAEIQALRKASANVQNWRLINATLYTTLEPCPMCLSATQAFRVSKIVYGAPDLRLGAIDTHIRLLDVVKHPFHDCIEVVSGIRGNECSQILVEFFKERRKKSKNRKKQHKVDRQQKYDDISTNVSHDKSVINREQCFNRSYLVNLWNRQITLLKMLFSRKSKINK